MDTQAGRQAGRQAGGQAGRQAGWQAGRQAGRQGGRQAGRALTVTKFLELSDSRQGRSCGLPSPPPLSLLPFSLQQLPSQLGLREVTVEGRLEGSELAAHHLLHLHREVLGEEGGGATNDAPGGRGEGERRGEEREEEEESRKGGRRVGGERQGMDKGGRVRRREEEGKGGRR